MNTYFIGCIHISHKWMAIQRGFDTVEEYDEHLIESWNKVVKRKDLVYILGDITMETNEHYHQLDRLNGHKIVVLGNHDLPKHVKDLLNHVESVAGMIDYKGCALTHCPIHPNEISFYRLNIHAHIHENTLSEIECVDRYGDDSDKLFKTKHKYFCVDAHKLNYTPITMEQILEKIK